MSYWGIFRLGRDLKIFTELPTYPHLWDVRQDDDKFIILSWSLIGAFLEIFS